MFNYGAPLGFKVRCITKETAASINGLLVNKKAKHGLHFERRKTLSRTDRLFRVHMFGVMVAQEENNPIRRNVEGFTEAKEAESSTYIFDDAHQAKCGASVDNQVLLAQDEDLGNQDVQLDLVRR